MAAIPYRPAIDGLRCMAVLSVFIFHLNPSWLPGGFVGVDIFFVISGFLITSIIYTDIQRGKFSLGAFYQRRIARLFPVFFVVALTTLAVGFYVYTSHDFATSAANFSAAVLSVANIKYILQGNYFTIGNDAQPFLHCWSLSVEEQFYIVFPLAFFLLCRWRRKAVLPVLGAVMGISFVACVLLSRSHPVWAFFLLPTRAWELMAGSVLAVWMNSRRNENGEGRFQAPSRTGMT